MIDSTTAHSNEAKFLHTVRESLVPGAKEVRQKKDFLHIFQKTDCLQSVERIQQRNDLGFVNLIASFEENCTPLNLGVHRVRNLKEAGEWITQFARSAEPEFDIEKHIIQHAHPDTHELQLWKRLANDPITVHTTFTEDTEIAEKTRASFIGITVADWGIAESATLVQVTAPSSPRSTSLVPSIHIGILRKNRLLANLAEAYAMLQHNGINSSFTFISGPSKTGDIEAHMVHGAHGPREMHVLIVE